MLLSKGNRKLVLLLQLSSRNTHEGLGELEKSSGNTPLTAHDLTAFLIPLVFPSIYDLIPTSVLVCELVMFYCSLKFKIPHLPSLRTLVT